MKKKLVINPIMLAYILKKMKKLKQIKNLLMKKKAVKIKTKKNSKKKIK